MKIKPILALIWGLLFCVPAHSAQLSIGVGTTANDGTGDTARVAFGKVNTNFTEVYSNFAALSAEFDLLELDTVSIVGDESIFGHKTFEFSPATPVTDLIGGTVLTVGKQYQDEFNANRTLTFSGTPSEGSTVSLNLRVTGTPTLTFPASKRGGEADASLTLIRLWPGLHSFRWKYIDTEWVLDDSVYAKTNTTTLDPVVTNDLTQGYGIGSTWTNTTDNGIFICSNAATGAAVWKELGVAAVGLTAREFIIPVQADETTALTTGTGKYFFRAPANMTITGARASLAVASSSGLPTFDLNIGDSPATILSTKLTIDASEKTSVTAAAQPVITSGNVAVDAQVSVDVDVAGTGASGAKVYLTAIPWDGIVPVTDYTTNLLARVGFEEGTGTSIVSTVGSMTGAAAAGGAFVTGKVGTYAYEMDAAEQINFSDITHFDGRTSVSWSIWFKRGSGTSATTSMFAKYTSGSNSTVTADLQNGNKPVGFVRATTGVTSQYASTVTDTNWHHLALTYDGSNQRLYLDGALIDTDANTAGLVDSTSSFLMGPITGGPVTLDDFRIYSEVLDTTKLGTIISAANP